MKTFENQAAQGDVLFRRVEKLPADAKPKKLGKGPVVVAHSETGHNHQFGTAHGIEVFEVGDPMVCYLRLAGPSQLDHLRPHDTHEAIMFNAGTYEVRRQREYTPQGWRRVED